MAEPEENPEGLCHGHLTLSFILETHVLHCTRLSNHPAEGHHGRTLIEFGPLARTIRWAYLLPLQGSETTLSFMQ